jgi:hypothetical protein
METDLRLTVQISVYGLSLFLIYGVLLSMLFSYLALFSHRARALYSMLIVSHDRPLEFLYLRLGPFIAVAIAVAYLMDWNWKWIIQNPTDSTYLLWGNTLAVVCMWIWLMFYVPRCGGWPWLLRGIPPEHPLARAFGLFLRSSVVIIYSFVTFGFYTLVLLYAWSPGPYAVYGMFLVITQFVISYYITIHDLSQMRRSSVPEAMNRIGITGGDNSVVLFMSDIHLTEHGEDQISGERSGNVNLDIITTYLSATPSWLVIVGDVVETGRRGEWIVAQTMLSKLRKRGIRILIAPGNHDLSGVYDRTAITKSLKKSCRTIYTS